jgi:hypothetical protein
MRDGGKGDKRRPLVIPEEQFNAQWDAIFNKQKKQPELEPVPFAGIIDVQEYHTPED